MTIDVAFSDEQRALAATARELFEKESPPARVRSVWDGSDDGSSLWPTMASVGLLGVTVAEDEGGMGGDEVDLALVLEEVGRAALPEPLAEVCVAALLSPTDGGGIARGDALVIATDEAFVPDADRAAAVIVDGRLLRAFEAARVPSLDHGRRLFRITARDEGTVVDAADHLAWARASVLNGISTRLLDDCTAYAADRTQFGVPIGSFQAVKHKLATMHTMLTAARAAAHGAAHALATGAPHAARAVSAALVTAIDAHRVANREALQIHAGIGFTFEHDLHFWLKRGLALSFGVEVHRARLARHVLEETDDA